MEVNVGRVASNGRSRRAQGGTGLKALLTIGATLVSVLLLMAFRDDVFGSAFPKSNFMTPSERENPICDLGVGSRSVPSGISVDLSANSIGTRDAVRVTLTVQNHTESSVVYWRGGQAVDFCAQAPDGRTVWTWSEQLFDEGRVFPQYLEREILEPGEVEVFRALWPLSSPASKTPPSRSGEYILQAFFYAGAEQVPSAGWWSNRETVQVERL